jgi:hypothetical protein
MSWMRRNWKAVLLALATAVGSLTADHTVAHRVSKAVVEVLPLVPTEPVFPLAAE